MLPACCMYNRLTRLLCLILAGSVLGVPGLTWKVDLPKAVSAVPGTCVVIPCRTRSHTRVSWYQYHSLKWPKVYDGRDLASVIDQFRGRTSVVGSPQGGNCSLRIEDVRMEDDGVHLYPWINPDESSSQKFFKQTVVLKVIRIEACPRISGQRPVAEGSAITLNCHVRHSCPISPPPLVWAGLPERHASSATMTADAMQGVWLSTATVSWTASWRDNGRKITCRAQLNRPLPCQTTALRLNVSYKPAEVNITAVKLVVKEGEAVTLKCHGIGNPQPSVYQWLERRAGETVQLHSSGKQVSVPRVRRDSSFSCIAQSPLGRSQSSWLSLNVQFSPIILSGSSCFGTGGALRCMCRAEANPKATLLWTVNGTDPPESFASVEEQEGAMVSAVLTGPLDWQVTVTCTAHSSLGNVTWHLPIHTMLGLLLPWMVTAAVCACAMIAVVVFLCHKWRKKADPAILNESERSVKFSIESLNTYIPMTNRTQASLGESQLYLNVVNLGPSVTYSNWTDVSPTHKTRHLDADRDLIYENCRNPADEPSV